HPEPGGRLDASRLEDSPNDTRSSGSGGLVPDIGNRQTYAQQDVQAVSWLERFEPVPDQRISNRFRALLGPARSRHIDEDLAPRAGTGTSLDANNGLTNIQRAERNCASVLLRVRKRVDPVLEALTRDTDLETPPERRDREDGQYDSR